MAIRRRDQHLDIVDPRRTSYDTRRALLSLIITFVVAAVVFGAFYYYYPTGPEPPAGPAATQSLDLSAPAPANS